MLLSRIYIYYLTYDITETPTAISLSFLGSQDSRTVLWVTNDRVTDSTLLLSTSNSFDNSIIYDGDCIDTGYGINIHKVVLEHLEYATPYYYKIGKDNTIVGHFSLPLEDHDVSFIHFNDAQTKDPNKLNVFKNTVALALKGKQPDFIVMGGDLFDSNMYYLHKIPSLEIMGGYTYKCIAQEFLPEELPVVYAPGNHEFSVDGLFSDFLGNKNQSSDTTFGFYSFDYNNIHFVVLDSNGHFEEQADFLKDDLQKSMENSLIDWRIIMMHNGPYSTGDHSDDEITMSITNIFPQIFAKYDVDLVLQAHDHVYSKTVGYPWESKAGETYYLCIGAAGHRYGEETADTFVTGKYKERHDPPQIGKISIDSSIAKAGMTASMNPNYPMFGELYCTDTCLIYNAYIVNGMETEIIDYLTIEKP